MAKNKKPAVKKTVSKPAAKKSPAPVGKAKATPAAKPRGKPAKSSPTMAKPSKKTALRDSILKRKAPAVRTTPFITVPVGGSRRKGRKDQVGF